MTVMVLHFKLSFVITGVVIIDPRICHGFWSFPEGHDTMSWTGYSRPLVPPMLVIAKIPDRLSLAPK